MREIKFRAWDKLNKKIVTSGLSINLDTTDRVIPISFSQGDLSYCRDNDVSSVPNVHTDIELMQWTGLKDKNGVEIYEGDIVKWSNKTYKVVWYEKIAGFVMEYNGIERPDIEFECEIIGNIYENPELLT